MSTAPMKFLCLFLFFIPALFKANGQSVIDYSTISPTACNIFASSTTVSTFVHQTNVGQTKYSTADKAVDLDGSNPSGTVLGTQYSIAFTFHQGSTYKIVVNAAAVTVDNFPNLLLRVNSGGNGTNTTCNGPQTVNGSPTDTHSSQNISSGTYTDYTFNFGSLGSAQSSLVLANIITGTGLASVLIKKITITETTSKPSFGITPVTTTIACGDQSSRTFTVTNPSNIPGTLSYTWHVGSSWNYNGAAAPATISGTSGSLVLQPVASAAIPPQNLSVDVFVNGTLYQTYYFTVVFSNPAPTLSITSNTTANTLCSSATLTLSGAPAGASISWQATPANIVTMQVMPSGPQITVTKSTSGSVTMQATVSTSCGTYTASYPLAVGTPVPNVTVDLSCPDAFANTTNAPGATNFVWSLYWTNGNQSWPNGTASKHYGSISGNETICVYYVNSCGTSTNECRPVYCASGTGGHSIAPPVLTVQQDAVFGDSLTSKDKNFKEFTIYPNPASDHLIVNLGAADRSSLAGIRSISIYNGLGVLVDVRKYPDMPRSVGFALKNLAQGIYLLKVEDGKTEKSTTLYIGK